MALCLVTRLKASVNNPDLPILGGMMCEIAPAVNSDGTVTLSLGATSPGQLEVELLNSTFEDGTTKKTLQAIAEYHKCSKPDSGILQVIINNKQYLRRIIELYAMPYGVQELNGLPLVELTLNKNTQGLDLSKLEVGGLSLVENLTMYSGAPKFKGTMDNLVAALNPNKLKTLFFLTNALPSFDISIFGRFVNLTTLNITGAAATGTVENFVSIQRSSGRETCAGIAIGSQLGNQVTFNGAVLNVGTGAKTLSWTSTTITINDVTINA